MFKLHKISLLFFISLIYLNACAMSPRPPHELEKEVIINMSFQEMFPDKTHRKLAKAAAKGDIRLINKIVESGFDVNTQGMRGVTALFWAMTGKKTDGFERLLQLGADPNLIYEDGGTVMHWAVISTISDDYLKLALQYGGNPNLKASSWNITPIFRALSEFSHRFDILVKGGADINAQDDKGNTPIITATNLINFKVVMKLLNLGADYRIKDDLGYDLAATVANRKRLIGPGSRVYQDMLKVIAWLEERGVVLPELDDKGRLIK